MSRLGVYDNWEKLVGAVIDRERLHQLALCDSFSSTSSSIATISRLSNVSSSSRLNIDYAAAASNELDQLTDPRAPNSDNVSTQASIARGVAAVVFAAPLAYYRRRRLREYDLFVSNYFIDDFPVHQLDQLERYSLRELQVATDNFSNRNVVGRGGFGKVYKGRLADGSLVAIKRHKEEHTQGGELMYRTEVKMKFNMSAHPNLLQLRGFCLTKKERMLVFPYMANGSVASRLRARTESQTPLDWATRERIALGSAKGIAYLHEQCGQKIIHRDVKAANILLNEDFEAVVGDFGLTEFMDHEDAHVTTHFEPVIFSFGLAIFMDHEDTHVTTAVRGTIGHIAPEYVSTGKASEKTDVFAYGIMLLELISGQRAFDLTRLANDDEVMLLDWVKRLLGEKKFDYLVDTDLRGNYIDEEVKQLIQVSLLCSQSSPEKRPKMSDVVQMLQGDNGLAERWQEYCGGSSYAYGGHGSNVSSSLLLNFDYAASSNAHELEKFSLHELQVATDNFCDRNLLGRSGFGKVYKGRLADGSLVAVKRIEEEHTENGERQFRTEVKMKFNTTAHPNLLQLRGFCLAPAERILVYPYMPNGSVASCLRERTESQPLLSWSTREQIALGSAKGLAYLHDQWPQKIVHRDVQAANILLNEDFEAIVSDFGLSEFLDDEDAHRTAHFEPVICDFGLARLDHDITHISSTSGVCGTIGHIAPEYLSTRKVSEKTDVFAYGIMLLELISAQRAFDLASLANDERLLLLDWVKRLLGEKKFDKLVDTDLRGNYNDEEVEQLIQVSLLCSQSSPEKRPKMSDVVQMLQGDDRLAERWQEYCDGSSYAFYHASTHGGHGSTINSLAIVSDEEIELSGPR